MNIIISLFIFILVLFLYLHIYFHLKTSNDLEIFEVANLSKDRLEEICNLRQPITFMLDVNCFEKLKLNEVLNSYGSFDIKMRDMSGNNSELYLPYMFSKAIKLLQDDKNEIFYSEQNSDFLEETSLVKNLKLNDSFLRPNNILFTKYDYLLGSQNSKTPLRYEQNFRNYLVLLSGSATVKLTPPKNTKYLYPEKDYDNFEYRSLIDPWNVQKEYELEFDKVKCLDVKLEESKLLFIPAYWWYSIKFNSSDTVILAFKYTTYMNAAALIPEYCKYFLQKQNIKHKVIENIKTL
tara:strand:- start:21 stop:899 length:879 start_codon:yes stop_codon:yes gene_type:complete